MHSGIGIANTIFLEHCKNCGQHLSGTASHNEEGRAPCPNCGSYSRNFSVHLQSLVSAESHDCRHSKHDRVRSRRRWLLEIISGDSYWRKERRWTFLYRVIDRFGDRYFERIVDKETGEIIIDITHPLSEHQGHGSAKRKKFSEDNS